MTWDGFQWRTVNKRLASRRRYNHSMKGILTDVRANAKRRGR